MEFTLARHRNMYFLKLIYSLGMYYDYNFILDSVQASNDGEGKGSETGKLSFKHIQFIEKEDFLFDL